MNRHYTKEQYVALAKKIQERIPGVSFTTDIIVGFPGETEEDFKETYGIVREVGLCSAYTYVLSETFWNTSSEHGRSGGQRCDQRSF